VGIPIVVLGFILVIIKGSLVGRTGNPNLILDTGGWVLVWVGLWFPLDTLVFSPLAYGRENRVLERLRRADIALEPDYARAALPPPAMPPGPGHE
jgi:hypothetical protein